MYKVDIDNKALIKLEATDFSSHNLLERFDIQEWIEKAPEILGEELLIIAKELALPSGRRLDLLAVDKRGALVVVELKRDASGSSVEWQAIKYTSYCANFLAEEIFETYAQYLGADSDDAQLRIEEFMDEEPDALNQRQRIFLCAKEFHSEVVSAVLWLRDFEVDIQCVRLVPYVDAGGQLFIKPDVIIPLPEAKDYIQRKETKQKGAKKLGKSSFSLEKSDFEPDELAERIRRTLARESLLTPRFRAFLEIVLSHEEPVNREELKRQLFEKGVGVDVGRTGSYLSNISQFLTKKSNPHLRQIIEFDSGGSHGETKDNYRIVPDYRELLRRVLAEGEAQRDVEET